MKIKVLLLVLCLTGCSAGLRQTSKYEKLSYDVDVYFEQFYLENSKYITNEKNLEGMSSEGGQAKGYYYNKKLKKIFVTLYGEMGKSEYEFYPINDDNVYLIQTDYTYDKPFYESPAVKTEVVKEYFITNNKIYGYSMPVQDIVENTNETRCITIFEKAKEKLLIETNE